MYIGGARIVSGLEHPNCICGQPAVWAFQLLTRRIFRCEDHKKRLESPVYKQSRIPEEGIELRQEDRFNIIDTYRYEDKPIYGLEELQNETKFCKYCESLVPLSDDEKLKRKEEVNEHFKQEHPKNYSQFIRKDPDGSEHSIILENPKDFFGFFKQKPQHMIAIPVQLLGEDEQTLDSGRFVDLTMLEISNNIPEESLDHYGTEESIKYWVDSIREKKLTEIQTMDLLDKMSVEAKLKVRFMTELFGEKSEYVKYLKGFEEIAKIQENCEKCMDIYKDRKDLSEDELKSKLMDHFKEDHREHFDKIRKVTHETNLEQKYSQEVRQEIAEELNDCKTCLQIIDNEFVSDEKVQDDLQQHIARDHPNVLEHVNVEDIIIQPNFKDGSVKRTLRTTTKSDENKIRITDGISIDVNEVKKIVEPLILNKYDKQKGVRIL